MSVQDDLRFASHRDMMRSIALIIKRAHLPLRYSQGFNPHPRLSLPCPRPVAVSSLCDLAVIAMDEPIDSNDLLARVNKQAPAGMSFSKAMALSGTAGPLEVRYELPVGSDKQTEVRTRLDYLEQQQSWPMERSGKQAKPIVIDLRQMIQSISIDDGMVRFELIGHEGRWARPAEVLTLLGLDKQRDLAKLVRSEVTYDIQAAME